MRKILNVEQRSPEWFKVRAGIPTASNFDKIITNAGEPSKQWQKYLWKLAGEAVTGEIEETYRSAAMELGIEREAEARETYELITGVPVQQVGFCLYDEDFKCGASPDGLVADAGLLEIKCPLVTTHISYLLGAVPVEYFQQIQGQMFVTGREWCDFMSYFPGMRPCIVRIQRNERFIARLGKELSDFCRELELTIKKIR